MKQENVRTGAESDLTDLDRELAQMAGEVPPMPADFHQKWMSAVREEAERKQEKPSRERKTTPWLRLLSTAAVFVFLIGGTMIYRASKNSRNAPAAAVEREAPAETAVVAEAEERSAPEEAAVPAAAGAFSAADTEAAPPPVGVYASEAAEEAAYEMDMAYEADAGSANEAMLFTSAEKSAPMMALSNSAAPEEAEEAEEAAETGPAAEPEPPEEAAQEQAEEKPAPEKAEPDKDDLGGFLKDMGDFLLAALPYLLGAAVLALLLSYLLTRKKRRGEP